MDDNERRLMSEATAVMTKLRQTSTTLLEQQQEYLKAWEDVFEQSLEGTRGLLKAMDDESQARTTRMRWSVATGLVALVLGVLALWNSATVGAGFHQTLFVAAGGALITFFLVELILHRILAISSADANKRKEIVEKYRSLNKKLVAVGHELLEDQRNVNAQVNRLLPTLRE
jgi:hypothetical protein